MEKCVQLHIPAALTPEEGPMLATAQGVPGINSLVSKWPMGEAEKFQVEMMCGTIPPRPIFLHGVVLSQGRGKFCSYQASKHCAIHKYVLLIKLVTK